jgi:hypothetical protein
MVVVMKEEAIVILTIIMTMVIDRNMIKIIKEGGEEIIEGMVDLVGVTLEVIVKMVDKEVFGEIVKMEVKEVIGETIIKLKENREDFKKEKVEDIKVEIMVIEEGISKTIIFKIITI